MSKTKKSFKDLVQQIEQINENKQGKLKGGFSSISGAASLDFANNNESGCIQNGTNCTVNTAANCGTTKPELPSPTNGIC